MYEEIGQISYPDARKQTFCHTGSRQTLFFLMIATCCRLDEVVVVDTYANTLRNKIIQGSGGSGKYIRPVGRSVLQYERNRRFGHLVHVLGRSASGAKLPSVGLCLNASKAEARLDMATLLLGLLFVRGRIGFGLCPGLRNLGLCLKCACLSWTSI